MIVAENLGFIHKYIPGTSPCTLLVLHGTGGDENDMLGLGREVAPSMGILSPRGNVLEGGMPRFFRRLAVGVYDEADVIFRAGELAEFVRAAATHYGFDIQQLLALGYSNGANIAAATLLYQPGVLTGAVLFRPMLPMMPVPAPDLAGLPVFIAAATRDPYASVSDTEGLADRLQKAGARVTLRWTEGGHGLALPEVRQTADWISTLLNSGANPD